MEKKHVVSLRHDDYTSGDAKVERVTYVEPDGFMRQDLVLNANDNVVGGTLWVFKQNGSGDLPLDVLDYHWEHLKPEFEELVETANYYYQLKNRVSGRDHNILLPSFLQYLTNDLLDQSMPDSEVVGGVCDPKYYPITTPCERFTALREAALDNDIPLDRYEMRMHGLERKLDNFTATYKKCMYGQLDEGMQLTGPDHDDPEDWHDEDIHDHPESWRGDEHPAEPEGYQEAEDPDDIREDRLDFLFYDYIDYIGDFNNAATRLWMDAAERIAYHQPTILNKTEIDMMNENMKQAKGAYQKFFEETEGIAGANFELQPLFDLIEDETNGAYAHMEGILNLASKPRTLETTMKKCFNKQRDEPFDPSL